MQININYFLENKSSGTFMQLNGYLIEILFSQIYSAFRIAKSCMVASVHILSRLSAENDRMWRIFKSLIFQQNF